MRQPPYHFGERVTAASTLHTSRRFHRFLNVSVGHRGSPVLQVRLPEASTFSVGFPPRNMPSPGAGHLPLMPLSTHRFLQNQYLRPLEGAPELCILSLPSIEHLCAAFYGCAVGAHPGHAGYFSHWQGHTRCFACVLFLNGAKERVHTLTMTSLCQFSPARLATQDTKKGHCLSKKALIFTIK